MFRGFQVLCGSSETGCCKTVERVFELILVKPCTFTNYALKHVGSFVGTKFQPYEGVILNELLEEFIETVNLGY